MGEWRETSLGEVIELKRGYDLPRQNRVPGLIPIISSSGLTDCHATSMVKGPGVVTGRYGTLGKVFYINEDFWPLNTTLYVRDFKGNNPRFISFLLQSLDFSAYSDKAAVPGLNRNHLHDARVRIPTEVLEQEAIASTLGSLDDKIELNRRTNQTLEETARAFFKDWFVDFGPVHAKLDGSAAYFSRQIWDLFPGRLDESDKPEGWIRSTIGEEVDVVGGSTPSTKEPTFWEGEIAWATPKDLASLTSPVLLRTERQITPAGLSQIGSGLLPAGTVLLSSRAPIGYLAVAMVPTAINQGFIGMICQKRLSNMFVWLWTKANIETVHQKANGSTFQEISKASFRPIPVILPTNAGILRAFDQLVGPLFDQIVSKDKENRTLTNIRDLLLPKLLTGQIRIKDAEKIVGEMT